MRVFVNFMIFLVIISSGQIVFAGESDEMQGITAEHNKVRRKVGAPDLTWADDLASYAQQWADHLAFERGCRMEHRPGTRAAQGKYGENLYWASAVLWTDGTLAEQLVTAEKVVDSWAREVENYSYETNSCEPGKVCGHYTQVVWQESKFIGCGRAVCGDKSQVWVCNYDPPGNVVGRKPYLRKNNESSYF